MSVLIAAVGAIQKQEGEEECAQYDRYFRRKFKSREEVWIVEV